jgi:hypothetical protein
MPCALWKDKATKTCSEYKDNGYNACSQYQDQGYNSCSRWDSKCCDWWPCSWACKLVTWFCVAWYWVSNIVCVAWYWVSNVVCVAWVWVTTAVCIAWDAITTAIGAVLETVESVLTWVLSALAAVVNLIFAIPVIGRFLHWVWDVVLTAVWGVAGLVDAVLWFIGIRPEKKLRMCVILLTDSTSGQGNENVQQEKDLIVQKLNDAIGIYRNQANVRIIKSGPFQYESGFADATTADGSWVDVYNNPAAPGPLDVRCGSASLSDDLTQDGSGFEYIATTQCFYSNFRRLIGYGAPIIVFAIRSFNSSKKGCSDGPLTDYVTVLRGNPICIAHESGHACNLWHVDPDSNLMNANGCGKSDLDWYQIMLLRLSRHVTYF